MKANEAPEKLYLHPTAKNNVGASWLAFPLTNEDVEYTRTDAFIEKACEWLKGNITYVHPRKGTKECIVNLTKFKDYMKGE